MSAPSTSGLSVIKSYCYELSKLNKVYFTLLYFTWERERKKIRKKPTVSMAMLSDICPIHFHIRSNAGIMAGNRDPVNQ